MEKINSYADVSKSMKSYHEIYEMIKLCISTIKLYRDKEISSELTFYLCEEIKNTLHKCKKYITPTDGAFYNLIAPELNYHNDDLSKTFMKTVYEILKENIEKELGSL